MCTCVCAVIKCHGCRTTALLRLVSSNTTINFAACKFCDPSPNVGHKVAEKPAGFTRVCTINAGGKNNFTILHICILYLERMATV